jgi:Heavy-metal resistance
MSEPNVVTTAPKRRLIPMLRSPWWIGLLVVSLMANLLVGGVIIGSKMRRGSGPFAAIENRAQLLPRYFFAELPRERRRELMDVFESKRDQLMRNRVAADAVTLKFADALEEQNASVEKLKSVVDEFTFGSASMVKQGNEIVLDVVAKLTPDERTILARAIRERAAHMPRK